MNPPDQPTRPTEAHYQLAHIIRQSSTQERAAQLIADSEARAIATQLEVVVILTRRWLNVEKERDLLRARAERAEAELAAAKERLRSEAMDDYASIKYLQRELATERARLNHVLRNDWPFRDRKAIDAAMKEDAK